MWFDPAKLFVISSPRRSHRHRAAPSRPPLRGAGLGLVRGLVLATRLAGCTAWCWPGRPGHGAPAFSGQSTLTFAGLDGSSRMVPLTFNRNPEPASRKASGTGT